MSASLLHMYHGRITIIDLLPSSLRCSICVIRSGVSAGRGRCCFMTRMPSVAVALLLLLAGPATAQEQRASIEGAIRDSSGGVLPGVTVEARSPSLAGVREHGDGLVRDVPVSGAAARTLRSTATLQGFQPAKSADVRLELGQVLKIDLAIAVGGVSETVKVTGEPPLIDVKQNSAGANVEAEIDRAHSQGPRLRRARDVGARHHQRGAKSRHPDRRRQRRRQPVHHRRRRHDEPVERHLR